MALSVAGLALTRRLIPLSTREAHNTAAGTVYAALYVVFGVSLGFSLFLVWQQFETARQTAEQEAVAVERIYRLTEAFPEPGRGRVRDLAVSYARTVVDDEWPLMGRGQTSPKAGRLAGDLGNAVQELEPGNDAQSDLYSESLTRLDDLKESRALRLLEVRESLPVILWYVLVIGGTLTVAFTYLFGMRSFLLHALAVAALTMMVSLVLFTIGVLDQPFDGDVRVDPEAFRLALDEIQGNSPQH